MNVTDNNCNKNNLKNKITVIILPHLAQLQWTAKKASTSTRTFTTMNVEEVGQKSIGKA